MKLEGKKIGLAITGSFCTFSKMEEAVTALMAEGASIYPIISTNVQTTDSRFGDTTEFISHISDLTGNPPILKLEDAEPIGPRATWIFFSLHRVRGTSMAKLANGITDTPVLMAAKAHLRNSKPLVISISTNDALGINFKNIGQLFNIKNIYFVPFGQDNAIKKPNSMIGRRDRLSEPWKKRWKENRSSRSFYKRIFRRQRRSWTLECPGPFPAVPPFFLCKINRTCYNERMKTEAGYVSGGNGVC